jgi:hypothetical protein
VEADGDSHTTYTFTDPAIKLLDPTKESGYGDASSIEFPENMKMLPTVINSNLWSFDYDSNGLYTNETITPAMRVLIATTVPVSFTREITQACPVAEFVSATGCYSCASGFDIVIKAKSTCEVASVDVTDTENIVKIYTGIIALTKTYQNFHIRGSTHSVKNDFVLALTDGDKQALITVSFTATQQKELNHLNHTLVQTDAGDDVSTNIPLPKATWLASTIDAFKDMFSGTNWWQGALSILGAVLVIIAMAIIVPMIIGSISSKGWCSKSKSGKIANE